MVIDPYPRDLQPTIYSDPRTIYSQPTNQYVPTEPPPRQTSASSTPSDATAPPVGTMPPTGNTYQRQQAQQLATRVTGSNVPTQTTFRPNLTRGSTADVQVGNVVYQSLQRPHLLRGGEWQLSMTTNLIAAAFVILAIMQWNWRMLPGALFFGGPVQYLLRAIASQDPRRWQKYVRSIGKPLIRLAHGKPDDEAPIPQILPKPSLFVH
jgi:type IV secretory pathway TrbD component